MFLEVNMKIMVVLDTLGGDCSILRNDLATLGPVTAAKAGGPRLCHSIV